MWWQGHCMPTESLIRQLNAIVRGWANYFRTQVATRAFGGLDRWMFHRQCKFAARRHQKKGWAWLRSRYWGQRNPRRQDQWVFGEANTGLYLTKFSWFRIQRHTIVKGTASPDDPQLRAYWVMRRAVARRIRVNLLEPVNLYLSSNSKNRRGS